MFHMRGVDGKLSYWSEFGVHTLEQYWPAFNSLRGKWGEGPTKHPNTPVVPCVILLDLLILEHQCIKKRATLTVWHFSFLLSP